jgi:hypothetical protein
MKFTIFSATFLVIATTGFGQNLTKNGTFDGSPSYKEWKIEVSQVANQQTGGNPGGWIWLNHNGGSTDPSASQNITGLKPGTIYRIAGDYKGGTNVHLHYRNKAANTFSIDIDGNSIKKMPLPQDLYKWTRFEATFTATKTSHTLKFRGEIDGADGDVALDNIVMVSVSKEIQLLSGGSEGKRNNSEIAAGTTVNLEVLFVDFDDQKVTSTNFDELWNTLTSKGELTKAFQRHGVKLNINLNKAWKRMPGDGENNKGIGYYFPKSTDAQSWEWKKYTEHSIRLLGSGTDYPPNTIVVVVPNKGATGFKSVGSGAHGGGYRGVRKMITLMPQAYNEHYTTLMHEIGHCFGSGELYPASAPYMHEVAGYDVMGDIVYATGFMGWHRLRYGWLPSERAQSLTTTGDIQIDMKYLSGKSGTAMIAVPDKTKASKLWVIEIGQDVVSRDQFKAGKGGKLNKEGDRIIVYTVENPEVSGKRAIRLVPRTNFSQEHGTVKWLDDVSYKETAGFKDFNKADAPFSFTVDKKITDGFRLTIKVK